MAQRSSQTTSLLMKSINQGELFKLNDADAIKLFGKTFERDFKRLKNAAATVESGGATKTDNDLNRVTTPSKLLFGTDYAEVNRTIVGMLALKWLMSNDYDAFTRYQVPPVKLRPESFAELRKLFVDCLKGPSDILALLISIVINDLGKDSSLAGEVAAITGDKSLIGSNHDMVVYTAAKAGMVQSLQELDKSHVNDMMLGLQFGSELNIAQLAQAENVPGSLKGATVMAGNRKAFDVKFLEMLLDVAGAGGHIDSRCAKQMIEPVFQGFMTSRKVLINIVEKRGSLRENYDQILRERGRMLEGKGFRRLSVDVPRERALLRLLTMGRTASKEQAEWFSNAFNKLQEPVRQALVDGLSVDGYNDGKAIIPYYMPALFSEGLRNTASSAASAKEGALGSLMRFLARVYNGSKPARGQPGVVVERSLVFSKDTIQSEAFKADPSVLDRLPVPGKF